MSSPPAPPPYEEAQNCSKVPYQNQQPSANPEFQGVSAYPDIPPVTAEVPYPPANHPGYAPTPQGGFPPNPHPHMPYNPNVGDGAAPQPQVQTVYVGTLVFSASPARIQCPFCTEQITTRITPKTGLLTWIIFGLLIFLGCCICACLPFCANSCQDIEHHCPKCKRYLGLYKRM